MPRTVASNRELIELQLTSCIQKLAHLRGTTPRGFPAEDREVVEDFGLACCRLMAAEMMRRFARGQHPLNADGDYEPYPLDEETTPGWKHRDKS